jgi:hypothetical protein
MKSRIALIPLSLLLLAFIAIATIAPSTPSLAAQVATVNVTSSATSIGTPITIASVTPTPFPTLPAGFVPPSPSPGFCQTPLPLVRGQTITLEGGVNLRNIPSLSGAVVNYYPQETYLTLLDGPVCANGYNWWYVGGAGQPGWVVEGYTGRTFITGIGSPTPACFPPLGLLVGYDARMFTGVRVRENPDPYSLVVTVALTDTVVEVIGGPVCVGMLNYWQVRVPFGSSNQNAPNPPGYVDGWVGEGYPLEDYWLEGVDLPPTIGPHECFRVLRLPPGTRAATYYSDGVPRSLRAAPSTSAAVIQPLIAGIAFDIISGPVCADHYNWWQVRLVTNGLTGWLAEGVPGNYWFDILYEPEN